jgi:hypothetical protein
MESNARKVDKNSFCVFIFYSLCDLSATNKGESQGETRLSAYDQSTAACGGLRFVIAYNARPIRTSFY